MKNTYFLKWFMLTFHQAKFVDAGEGTIMVELGFKYPSFRLPDDAMIGFTEEGYKELGKMFSEERELYDNGWDMFQLVCTMSPYIYSLSLEFCDSVVKFTREPATSYVQK